MTFLERNDQVITPAMFDIFLWHLVKEMWGVLGYKAVAHILSVAIKNALNVSRDFTDAYVAEVLAQIAAGEAKHLNGIRS